MIVEPASFPTSDRAFRRAGMDYLDRAAIERHISFAAFEAGGAAARRAARAPDHRRRALPYWRHDFRPDDVLMVGRESAGVPQAVHEAADARLTIPLRPGLRSLNVAVAAAMVLGEALRQTSGFPPVDPQPVDAYSLRLRPLAPPGA